MSYLGIWIASYVSPKRFADGTAAAPAPRWGLLASLQRGLMDSVFTYLPVFLLGRTPPLRPFLPFIPADRYYGALVLLAPVVLLAEWLMGGALTHVILRLAKRRSDMDRILNISGFAVLSVGSVLVAWDAAWTILGGMDQYALGISHLLINCWAVVLTTVALRRNLDVPVWLGILLCLGGIVVAAPFAVMFMRSPV